jgi:two-component system NtrC family response regulator
VSKPKVLIIDGEETTAAGLRSVLNDEFDVCLSSQDPASGFEEPDGHPLVILLNLESPSSPSPEDGLRVLQELWLTRPGGGVIVYTNSSERGVAVQAVRHGASDVLSKPLDFGFVKGLVRRAVRIAELEREGQAGREECGHPGFKGMLGTSASMDRIFDAVRKVSTNDAPILITGESGTGKELTAKTIHERGLRRQAPFMAIHCGAIPENLLESELFGYEGGASTGPVAQKKGKMECAQGGTLFLDGVGDLPLSLQGKLWRVLHKGAFERVGGHEPIDMNVRIIAATDLNLQEAVEKGSFREDLYERLGAVHINLPPLRARGEDVSLIATAFLRQAAARYGKILDGFTREALEAMRAYHWPGNVRELSGRVDRAVVMAEGTEVSPADLDIPHQIAQQEEDSISLKINQQRIETDLIMKAFTLSQGNLSRAAHKLGISRSTLYRRLRQYGMDRTLDARRALGSSPRVGMSDY